MEPRERSPEEPFCNSDHNEVSLIDGVGNEDDCEEEPHPHEVEGKHNPYRMRERPDEEKQGRSDCERNSEGEQKTPAKRTDIMFCVEGPQAGCRVCDPGH